MVCHYVASSDFTVALISTQGDYGLLKSLNSLKSPWKKFEPWKVLEFAIFWSKVLEKSLKNFLPQIKTFFSIIFNYFSIFEKIFACGALKHNLLLIHNFSTSYRGVLGNFRGGDKLLSPPPEGAMGADLYVRHPLDPLPLSKGFLRWLMLAILCLWSEFIGTILDS